MSLAQSAKVSTKEVRARSILIRVMKFNAIFLALWYSLILVVPTATAQPAPTGLTSGDNKTPPATKALPSIGSAFLPQIEFRLQRYTTDKELGKADRVPLVQLPQHLSDRFEKSIPLEFAKQVKTAATFRDGQLFGISEFTFSAEDTDRTFRLAPFSAPILLPSQLETWLVDPTDLISSPSYFDAEGVPNYDLKDSQLVRVAWQLSGEPSADAEGNLRFDFSMPWSSDATWEVHLPEAYRIEDCNGPAEDNGRADSTFFKTDNALETPVHRWTIQTGGSSRMQFDVAKRERNGDDVNYVFSSEQIDWVVQSAGLEVNASYVLESKNEPRRMALKIDPAIRLRSVSWDQQIVEYEYLKEENVVRFRVPASEGMFAGTQHRLVVNGISGWPLMSTSIDSAVRLPSITLSGGTAAEGRGSVSLHSDWELVNFNYSGANLTSRSGTTTPGGISRLDFSWRLSRPVIEAKLVRKQRTRKVEGIVSISNNRDQLAAVAKVRVLPVSDVWNRLQLEVPPEWLMESIQLEGESQQTSLDQQGDSTGNLKTLTFNPPVDNKPIELTIQLRSTAAMNRYRNENNLQVMELPKTVPLRFLDADEDLICEYMPATGYTIERTPELLHRMNKVTDLDVWKQSKLRWPSQSFLVQSEKGAANSIRLTRQRSNIDVKSLLQITRDVNWTNNTYLIAINPDPTGIRRFDVWIPEEASQLIWRVFNSNKVVLQEWQEGKIGVPSTQSELKSAQSTARNVSLAFDRAIAEPMYLEIRYRLPLALGTIPVPQVSDYEFNSRFVVTEDRTAVSAVRDQIVEPLERVDLGLEQSVQSQAANDLLNALPSKPVSESVFLWSANGSHLKLIEENALGQELIVLKSIERLFVQLNSEPIVEISLSVADVEKQPLKISLPRGWRLLSVVSRSQDLNYVVNHQAESTECEVTLPTMEREVHDITMQWMGPMSNLERGFLQLQRPKVSTNFLSIRHMAMVMIADEAVPVSPASSLAARWQYNATLMGQPWTWTQMLSWNDSTSIASDRDERYGFCEIESLRSTEDFKRFSNSDASGDATAICVTSKTWILFQRWWVLIATAVACAWLMRVVPLLSTFIVLGTLAFVLFLPRGDLVIVGSAGNLLGLLWGLVRAVMRPIKLEETSPSHGELPYVNERSTGSKIQPALIAKSVVVWLLACAAIASFAQVIQAQDSLAVDAQKAAATDVDPTANEGVKIIVPVDGQTFRVSPFAFVQNASDVEVKTRRPASNNLLSAHYVLSCRPNQSVLGIYTASVVCKYQFQINDAQQPVTFPWDIRRTSFQQFTVQGKTQYFGKSFSVATSSLTWIPNQLGVVEVELKLQLLSRNLTGRQMAQLEILPCAAAQLELDTDLSSVQIATDLSSNIVIGAEKGTPIGSAKALRISWDSNSTDAVRYDRLQYDCDTQLILATETPIAVSRLRLAGYSNQPLTLDWNSAWTPVGQSFGDAERGTTIAPNVLGRDRTGLKIMPMPTASSRVLELEIYWKPVATRFDSVELPNPRILEATSNIRTLRYAQESLSNWVMSGIDSWTRLETSLANATGSPNAIQPSMTVLRVPEVPSTASIVKNNNSSRVLDVFVNVDYTLGSNLATIQWKGDLAEPVSGAPTHSWIIDGSVEVESIRFDGEETLFTVDSWNENFKFIQALNSSPARTVSRIEIEAFSRLSLEEDSKLPLIHWSGRNVLRSQFTIARQVGLPIGIQGLPPTAPALGTLLRQEDSKELVPFIEVIATGDESIPYQLPLVSKENTASILEQVAVRTLAQVRVERKAPDFTQEAYATLILEPNQRQYLLEFEFENESAEGGALFAVPVQQVDRFKSSGTLTTLASNNESAFIYVTAVSQKKENKTLHRVSLSIEESINDSMSNFSVPAIECLSVNLKTIYLTRVNRVPGQALQWDTAGWQKIAPADFEARSHDKRINQNSLLSNGRLPSVHVSVSKSVRSDGRSPFALWKATDSNGNLVLEGVICVSNETSPALNIEIPDFVNSVAFELIGQNNPSQPFVYNAALQKNLGGRTAVVKLSSSSLPQLIGVRALVDRQQLSADATFRPYSFALTNSNGVRYTSEKVYWGQSKATFAGLEAVDRAVSDSVKNDLSMNIEELLNTSRSAIERLPELDRANYVSTWLRFSRGLDSQTEIHDSSKERATLQELVRSLSPIRFNTVRGSIFSGNPSTIGAVGQGYSESFTDEDSLFDNVFLRGEAQGALIWTFVGKGVLLRSTASNTLEANWLVLFRLGCWYALVMLLTIIVLPTKVGGQLRAMLSAYPWRLLLLIAMILAIIPYSILPALIMGILAGLVACANYVKVRIASN